MQQGGDKLTLNLNGGGATSAASSLLLPSPTTPKVCNMPSMVPLIPTPIEKNANKNESVTVTHFSDIHGGVVEKISVPVTTGSSAINGQSSPKVESSMTSTTISNNPFADDMMTIITTAAITSPTIKISTNPFLGTFHSSEKERSMRVSFPIEASNPFQATEENGNGHDEMDNENNLSSISSVNLKSDNESNVTTIKMETTSEPAKAQVNGFKEPPQKVTVTCRFVFHRMCSSFW